MKYKVIFFDADGVVLKGGYRFTDMLTEQFGLKIENMLPFFEGPFLECAVGKADVVEELEKVIGDWGWQGTVDELMRFWLSEGTVFDENTLGLVLDLSEKGVKCFVSTGQESYRGAYIKEKVGEGKPFADVFYTGEIGFSKKDVRFYEEIFERVSRHVSEKSEILLIDDSKHVVDMAKDFGFDAILYSKPSDVDFLQK